MGNSRIMSSVFFFNDTATTEIYTLSLHDALPISSVRACRGVRQDADGSGWWRSGQGNVIDRGDEQRQRALGDRKSTRLNSSHQIISYAVFCLKKKKNKARRISSYRTSTRTPSRSR